MCLYVVLLQKARSAEYQKEITEGKGFNSCDAYAVAAAVDDTLITESDEVRSKSAAFMPLKHKKFHSRSLSHNLSCSFPRLQWQWSCRGPTPKAWWCWTTWSCWKRNRRLLSWRKSTWRHSRNCSWMRWSRWCCNKLKAWNGLTKIKILELLSWKHFLCLFCDGIIYIHKVGFITKWFFQVGVEEVDTSVLMLSWLIYSFLKLRPHNRNFLSLKSYGSLEKLILVLACWL